MKTETFDVAALLGNGRDSLSVKRVFGDPIDQNGTRVIPVARVRGGGGGGGGTSPEGEGAGSGAGFGMTADPAGAFVIVGDEVTWRPALNPERVTLAAFGLAAFAFWTLRSILVGRRHRRH